MTTPQPPSFSGDFVADDVDSSLNVVQDFITQTLAEKLKVFKELADSDTVDAATLKNSAKELAGMVEAFTLARDSITQAQKGRNMEARVLQTASDESLSLPDIKNNSDLFAEQAAAYFDSAKSKIENAAQLVSKQPGFFAAVTQFFKKSPEDQSSPVQSFWDKVSVATFGLAVLSSRVTKLPKVIMEQLEQKIDQRVVAVTEVVNHWKQRAASEYYGLKSELGTVVHDATSQVGSFKEHIGQNVQQTWDKTVSIHNAATQVLEENVDKVLNNFSGASIQSFIDKARDKINSWSAGVYEVAQQQKASFRSHYESSLQQRSTRTGPTPPPLPERVEPHMPKTP